MQLHIQDLKVRCIVGIYRKERVRRQTIYFDIVAEYSSERIQLSDRIEDGVCYASIASTVEKTAIEGRFLTLEALCRAAADAVFSEFAAVTKQQIKIRKPAALPGSAVAGVSCWFTR